MNDKHDNFANLVTDRLRSLMGPLHLAEPQLGDADDLIACAAVNGLKGGTKDRILAIAKRQNGLVIRLHRVFFVGSKGDLLNRMSRHTLRRLFAASEDDIEKLNDDQWMLLGLLADEYRRQPRTTDELLAHLVNGSNDWTVRTKAYVDWSDGEVVVDLPVPSDFKSLPADFEKDVFAVLSHGAGLVRLEELVRHTMSPDVPMSARTVSNLTQKLAGLFELKQERETEGKENTANDSAGSLVL